MKFLNILAIMFLQVFSFALQAADSFSSKSFILKGYEDNYPELPSGITNFVAHEAAITSVRISPDSKLIASGSKDGSIKIWNINTGQLFYELKKENSYVSSISWSPDSSKLAILYRDRKLVIWDLDKSEKLDEKELESGTATVVSWSPDGSRIAVAINDRIRIYKLDARFALIIDDQEVIKMRGRNDISHVLFWISEDILLSAGSNQMAEYWMLENREVVPILLSDVVTSAVFFDPYLMVSLVNKSIVKWNLYSEKDDYIVVNVGDVLTGMSLFKGSAFLVTGGISGNIVIRNMIGATKVVDLYHVSNVPITDIDWSIDGRFIVASSSDKTLTIWKDPLKHLNLHAKNRSINDLLDSINDNEVTQIFNEVDFSGDSLFLNDLRLTNLKGLQYLIQNPKAFSLLNLENNKIRNLDQNLKSLKALSALYLDDNEIVKLGDSLDNLENLDRLDINRNKLTDLGNLKGLKKLETLSVLSNKIVDVRNSFDDLIGSQTLKYIYMIGNPLSQESLAKLRALKAVSPVGLKIDVLCDPMDELPADSYQAYHPDEEKHDDII